MASENTGPLSQQSRDALAISIAPNAPLSHAQSERPSNAYPDRQEARQPVGTREAAMRCVFTGILTILISSVLICLSNSSDAYCDSGGDSNCGSEGGNNYINPTEPAEPAGPAMIQVPTTGPSALAAELKAADEECRDKRLRGELKNYMESVQCSNPRIIAAYQKRNYRYMDLINLFAAARLASAEKVSNGEITAAQAQLDLVELRMRITNEERRRDLETVAVANQSTAAQAARSQANAATLAEFGNLLQGLAAFQSGNRPAPVICSTLGNLTACLNVPEHIARGKASIL